MTSLRRQRLARFRVPKYLLGLGVAIAGLAGIVAGLGGYTFFYAEGASYLTNNPQACANCHVMKEQLDGWMKSSHHAVAVCNDCHAPHNFIGKYLTKGINGWNHSWAFTTGRFPDPIRITPFNHRITENACRHCHQDIVDTIDTVHAEASSQGALSCTRCHPNVGHMH